MNFAQVLLVLVCLYAAEALKCKCGMNARKEFGHYGIISVSETINGKMDESCHNVLLDEAELTHCVAQLFDVEANVGIVQNNHRKGTLERSMEVWNHSFSINETASLIDRYTHCEFVETQHCHRIKGKKTIRNIRTNLPVVQELNNEEGPITKPTSDIYLLFIGHYPKLNTFQINVLYRFNLEISYTCSCVRQESQQHFTKSTLVCTISGSDCQLNLNNITVKITDKFVKNNCDNDHMIIQTKRLQLSKNSNQGDSYMVCENGTVMLEETGLRFKEESFTKIECENWVVTSAFEQCQGDIKKSICLFSDYQEDSKSYLKIRTSTSGYVKVLTSESTSFVQCEGMCNIQIPKEEVTFVCPNGESKTYYPNKLDPSCPWVSNYLTGKLAVYVCRATYRPNIFWFLLVFLFLGRKIMFGLYLIFDSVLYVLIRIYRIIRKRGHYVPYLCIYCDEPISYKILEGRHKRCFQNVCPYCRSKAKDVKKHSEVCKSKEITLKEAEKEIDKNGGFEHYVNGYTTRDHERHPLVTLSWVIIVLILFSTVIYPVGAKKFEVMSELMDKWVVDECPTDCVDNEGICLCDVLADQPQKNRTEENAIFDYNKHLTPIYDRETLDLTFESRSFAQGKVMVSGTAQTIMELDEYSGKTWKVRSNDGRGESHISVYVKSVAQRYKSTFLGWTADRKIIHGVDNSCSGKCSEKCGCEDSACKYYMEENDRSWSCNPTWCWSIGRGCSCCFMNVDFSATEFIVSEFQVEFEKTLVELCVSKGKEHFTCRVSDHNTKIDLGDVVVSLSKAFNVQSMLHGNIHLFYKKNNKGFDFSHPSNILQDVDICAPSYCKHGEAGDVRFNNISKIGHRGVGDIGMAWEGVQMHIDCVAYHWPNCIYDGVVENNRDKFEELLKTGKHLSEDFNLKKADTRLTENLVPTLNLVVTPKVNRGQIQVTLVARNMELESTETLSSVKILTFKIKRCNGCYSCFSGMKCEVAISINSKKKKLLKFTSGDEGVLVESNPYVLSDSIRNYNVSVFSTVPVKQIKICMIETCRETDKLTITDTPLRMISSMKSITLQGNTTSESIDYLDYFRGFCYNTFQFLKSLFFSPLLYILMGTLLLLIIIPKLFGLLPIKQMKKHIDLSKLE